MKKYSKFLIQIALVLLFVMPLTINNVKSLWTYYEGKVETTSDFINVILGSFDFNPPKYDNEYGEGDDNGVNRDTLDKLMGTEKDNYTENDLGIFNPGSDLTIKIKSLAKGEFITSIDTGNPSGDKYRETFGLGREPSFVIYKASDNSYGGDTFYNIFTTDTILFPTYNGIVNNQNAPTANFQVNDIIDNVFKATVKCNSSISDVYTILSSERGYCEAGNINGKVFMDVGTWRHGASSGLEIVYLKNMNEYLDYTKPFSVKAVIGNKKQTGVNWEISSNLFNIKPKKDGTAEISYNNKIQDFKLAFDYSIIKVTGTKNDKKGSLSFKLDLRPDSANTGIIVNKDGYTISSGGITIKKGSSDYAYPRKNMNQALMYNYDGGRNNIINIHIETYEKNLELEAQYNNDSTGMNIFEPITNKNTNNSDDPNVLSVYDYTFTCKKNNAKQYMFCIKSSKPVKYTIS